MSASVSAKHHNLCHLKMIVGRMTSQLNATIFDLEGYSSHEPPNGPPDKDHIWAPQKFVVVGFDFLVLGSLSLLPLGGKPAVGISPSW
jgi:hypothetical protein